MNNKLNEVKSIALTLLFAVVVLIFTVNVVKESQQNIVGRAFYSPIQIYGKIEPALPDGTKISFRLNGLEVVSTEIKNSSYGYEERLFFLVDDESTLKREGYREGDIVGIYIEDIRVGELSYFKPGPNEKYINIPVSKRNLIASKSAFAVIERSCEADWQCEEWSECINGIQTRNCADINKCETEEGKPEQRRECEIGPLTEEPFRIKDFITAEWILTVSLFIILTISFILLIRKAVWEHKIRKHVERKRKKKSIKKKSRKKITKKKR
jgi:hypothetical protein